MRIYALRFELLYFISAIFFGYFCPIWLMQILANANFFQNQMSHQARTLCTLYAIDQQSIPWSNSLKITCLYSILDRALKLEQKSSNMEVHKLKSDAVIDFETWRSMRGKEKAKDELTLLLSRQKTSFEVPNPCLLYF